MNALQGHDVRKSDTTLPIYFTKETKCSSPVLSPSFSAFPSTARHESTQERLLREFSDRWYLMKNRCGKGGGSRSNTLHSNEFYHFRSTNNISLSFAEQAPSVPAIALTKHMMGTHKPGVRLTSRLLLKTLSSSPSPTKVSVCLCVNI